MPRPIETSGPAAATRNSTPGLLNRPLSCDTPPNSQSVIESTSIPSRRATHECPSSCSAIDARNSRDATTAIPRYVLWDRPGFWRRENAVRQRPDDQRDDREQAPVEPKLDAAETADREVPVHPLVLALRYAGAGIRISERFASHRSLGQHEQGLALLDEIGRELRSVPGADILHRVDRLGRDEEDVARLESRRRFPLDFVLQRAFEDVDDLLARMLVPDRRRLRSDVDTVLDDLASGGAEIALLEVRACDPVPAASPFRWCSWPPPSSG